MTTFVWQGREVLTIGNLIDAMDRLATREEALEFLAAYRQATEHADTSAGYATGYLAPEQGQRLRDWMDLDHPVFGRTPPEDPNELVKLGQRSIHGGPGPGRR